MVQFALTFKLKHMKLLRYIVVVVSLQVLLHSCETDNLLDANKKQVYVDSSKMANVKFIQNFAGNTPQLPTAPNSTTGPQLFIYANGQKVNGTALGYAGFYPSTTVYSLINAGSNIKFDLVMARLNLAVVPNAPAPIAGDTLLSFNQTLEAGKFYSFMIGDSVPSLRVAVKEDIIGVPDFQNYRIRLANWLMNPTDTISVYSRRQASEIIQNITHKQISDWIQLPLPIISDTLELRRKGSTTTYATVGGTAPTFSPIGERYYTIIARGKTGVTGKTPSAGIVTNR